jgi:nucleotide-binding universal stress UspA family protein
MKVLVAVDGSKFGRWAAQWVGRIPFAKPPQLRAVHVLDLAALRTPFMPQPAMLGYERFFQDQAKRLSAHAKRVAAETKALLTSSKLHGTVAVEKGPVAPTLLNHGMHRGGLIVLGHRGLSNLDRFFLGSVSEKVTLHAPCSVLVIKQAPRPIKRILLAVDGSKASDQAVQFLLREAKPAKRHGITVTVLHVLPPFAYSRVAIAGITVTHRYANKLAAAGYRVKEAYLPGDPADEIVKAAKRLRADLLLAGAKGLGAVGRFLLGSVSTKLLRHSPCSILIVR